MVFSLSTILLLIEFLMPLQFFFVYTYDVIKFILVLFSSGVETEKSSTLNRNIHMQCLKLNSEVYFIKVYTATNIFETAVCLTLYNKMRGEFVASCLRRSHVWIDIVLNIVINLFGTFGLRLKSLNVLMF